MVLNSTQRTLIRSFISLQNWIKVHDHYYSFVEAPAYATVGIGNLMNKEFGKDTVSLK